jgi:hypothetical protein
MCYPEVCYSKPVTVAKNGLAYLAISGQDVGTFSGFARQAFFMSATPL